MLPYTLSSFNLKGEQNILDHSWGGQIEFICILELVATPIL